MIARLLLVGCVALGLGACQGRLVGWPMQRAMFVYGDLRQVYGEIAPGLRRACTPPAKLEADLCGRLDKADERLREIDADLRAQVAAGKEIDWAATIEKSIGLMLPVLRGAAAAGLLML